MTRVRRAGSRWRLLAHEWAGPGVREDGCLYGTPFHIGSRPATNPRPGDVVLPDTEFDELVVGRWLHVEQMDTGRWWMHIGGVTVHVHADRDGRPRRVTVHGPGGYAGPVDGCEYEVVWSEEEGT